MNYTPEDVELLAKCGYLEAAGEGIFGVYCVMHVIVNRVGVSGFPKTLHEVIYQPNAFSWTRADNKEHDKVIPDDAVWRACLADAPFVLQGDADPVHGACYYANLETLDKGGWFVRHISGIDGLGLLPGHEFVIKVGRHSFYR